MVGFLSVAWIKGQLVSIISKSAIKFLHPTLQPFINSVGGSLSWVNWSVSSVEGHRLS